MKSLDRIITDNLKRRYVLPDVSGFRTIDEFMDLNGFTEETLTEEARQFYFTHNYSDRVHREYDERLLRESLDSAKTDIVIKKIKEKFGVRCSKSGHRGQLSDRYSFEIIDNEKLFTDSSCYHTNNLVDNKNSKELYELLDRYKYYVSVVDNWDGDVTIYICPYYGDSIYKKSEKRYKYAYHITLTKNVEGILKKGLIPKSKKTGEKGFYRYFPERTYLLYCDNKELPLAIKRLCSDLGIFEWDYDDFHILQIDVSKWDIPVFPDEASSYKGAAYTHHAIPPQIIKDLGTLNDYYELHI